MMRLPIVAHCLVRAKVLACLRIVCVAEAALFILVAATLLILHILINGQFTQYHPGCVWTIITQHTTTSLTD